MAQLSVRSSMKVSIRVVANQTGGSIIFISLALASMVGILSILAMSHFDSMTSGQKLIRTKLMKSNLASRVRLALRNPEVCQQALRFGSPSEALPPPFNSSIDAIDLPDTTNLNQFTPYLQKNSMIDGYMLRNMKLVELKQISKDLQNGKIGKLAILSIELEENKRANSQIVSIPIYLTIGGKPSSGGKVNNGITDCKTTKFTDDCNIDNGRDCITLEDQVCRMVANSLQDPAKKLPPSTLLYDPATESCK